MTNMMELLLMVGKNPCLDRKQLKAKASFRSVNKTLYKAREYGFIVKTCYEPDRERGLRWELTGGGFRKLKSLIKKEENNLNNAGLQTMIAVPAVHQYKPLHKRK